MDQGDAGKEQLTRRLAVSLVVAFIPVSAHGQSCLIGRVVDAGGGQPIAGAAVSADWAVAGSDRLKAASGTATDSLGLYKLCLSSHSSVLVHAIAGMTVAYLPVTTPSADTILPDLRVPPETDTGSAIVAGHVVSEDGKPVEGATVTILGSKVEAPTAPDGAYGLRAPEGTQVLLVRRIGLGAAVVPVQLFSKHPRLVNVAMQRLPPTLDVVTITADRLRLGPVYEAIGLTARARAGHGHILTLDDIEAKQASNTIQLFEGVPGIRFRSDPNGQIRVFPFRNSRVGTINGYGDCTAYAIDGVVLGNGHAVYSLDPQTHLPRGNEDETTLPPPSDLIAVEVYQPGEPTPIQSGMVDRCLKILLWTKAMLGKP